MQVSCSAHGCTNRRQRESNIHFFSFILKNAERNQLWINAAVRKGFIPTKNSAICSAYLIASDSKSI
ncbi:THAP domain-containing protein 1-like [Melanaphis sacchari]|uniref:THAP domain-containing protein 1-like n=1 Tax=Melanaphis sacchari TaxID=742174 RepID=UPI000DC15163|nr:THAP domain-containing protein 1-like [Melanaphis sacchari]